MLYVVAIHECAVVSRVVLRAASLLLFFSVLLLLFVLVSSIVFTSCMNIARIRIQKVTLQHNVLLYG